MELADKYAYLGKTVLMTLLYIPLMPVGILISLVGIFFFYFIEKYNITRAYQKPPSIDSGITMGYIENFRLFIFIYAISVYAFLQDTYFVYFKFILFSIILYGVLVLIPYTRLFSIDLLKCIVLDKYDEQYFNFTTKYETENPITKKKANYKFAEKLLEKEIISHQEYSNLIAKLNEGDNVDLMEIYREKMNVDKKLIFNAIAKKPKKNNFVTSLKLKKTNKSLNNSKLDNKKSNQDEVRY